MDFKNINNEYKAEKKETKDDYEKFKNEQKETRIQNLKQKRFEKIYSKEKLEGKELKIAGKEKDIDRIFKRNAVIKYKNMNMYNYIIGKKNIPENSYKVIKIEKDGNCFYRCVSFYLYGTVKYHDEIRETISKICIENIDELSEFQEYVEIRKDKYISTREYIYMISNEGNWETNIDITVTSYLYNINIAIYFMGDNEKQLEYVHSFSYGEQNYTEPLLILLNENLIISI